MAMLTAYGPDLAALLLAGLGAAGMLMPQTMAAFVGLGLVAPEGISEMRSTLGCFFLCLGVASLWLQSPEAFTLLGAASLGAAFVRLLSCLSDRSASIKNFGGVVSEALLGGLFLLVWL